MDIDQHPTRKRGQRSWTDAQRAAQARTIRKHQVWKKSTGPKTPFGKSTSSRNSYKNGHYTYERRHERKILFWYSRLAAMRNKQIRHYLNFQKKKRENELLNKYGMAPKPRPWTMAFYPYFKVDPLDYRNKPPKPQSAFDYLTSLSEESW